MSELKKILRESEYRLLNIIQRFEPLTSEQLIPLAESELGWKKPTILRMLKRLLSAGYCSEEESEIVSSVNLDDFEIVISRSSDESTKRRILDFLPRFITAYIRDDIYTKDGASFINRLYRRQ